MAQIRRTGSLNYCPQSKTMTHPNQQAAYSKGSSDVKIHTHKKWAVYKYRRKLFLKMDFDY